MKIIVRVGFPVLKMVEDLDDNMSVGDFLNYILPKCVHEGDTALVKFKGKSLHLLDKDASLLSAGMYDGCSVGVYDMDMLMNWMF